MVGRPRVGHTIRDCVSSSVCWIVPVRRTSALKDVRIFLLIFMRGKSSALPGQCQKQFGHTLSIIDLLPFQ